MFDTERMLVDLLKKKILNGGLPFDINAEKIKKIVLAEVDLGFGIADIVLTHARSRSTRDVILDKKDIAILTCIQQHQGINVHEVSSKTGIPLHRARKSLSRLIDGLFIYANEHGLTVRKRYRYAIKETIAFEAKLDNWNRALKQAYRYRWFANMAIVCIPEEKSRQAMLNIEKFKKLRVGLITLNNNGEITTLYTPQMTPTLSTEMHMLLNEKVVTRLGAS